MPAALIQVAPDDTHVDEVETSILGVVTKEDVVELDVSMDPTVAVKTLQMIQGLEGNLAYTRDLKPASCWPHILVQTSSLEFHDHTDVTVQVEDVMRCQELQMLALLEDDDLSGDLINFTMNK